MSKKGSKSSLTFLHEKTFKQVKDNKVIINEESVIDGTKGLTFKLYQKEDDKKKKFIGKSKDDGTYELIIIDGDKKEVLNFTNKELLEFVKKNPELEFVHTYLKTRKLSGGKKGYKLKSNSKRGSRKGTKKSSRKGTKKGSRK